MNIENTIHLSILKTLSLSAIAGVFFSCDRDKSSNSNTEDSKPNLVLIVSDDHGQNDAGCYGNVAIKTPNIDYLASEGVRFTNAYCTSASCSASRSVILTGLYNHATAHYGHTHHFHHFSAYDHVKSLPVLLDSLAGYHTARIGKYHVAPEEVFHFQTVLKGNERNAVEMADSCERFLEENKNRPFFLYFCTSDPHRGGGVVEDDPLKPNRFGNKDDGYKGVKTVTFSPDEVLVPEYLPNTPECRAELAQYYQSVSRVDQGLGKLFEYLREKELWENTVIMYISDNGIAFPGAKTNIYQPGINLPCLVKPPKSYAKNVVNDALINWADITPTFLDYAGVLEEAKAWLASDWEKSREYWASTTNKDFHGRSFKSIITSASPVGWNETYASHTFHEITMYYPMRTVITRDYKLIWNIAHPLPYPHSTDLWVSATWQSVYYSENQMYAGRSIQNYIQRPEFELYDIVNDPYEFNNLADIPKYSGIVEELKGKIKTFQERTNDPWVAKWEHE